MTEAEARILLKYHSFNSDDLEHPKMKKGFLGMLRPFQGELYEKNFHELMDVLKTLSPILSKETIDRELISSFWCICNLGRIWCPDNLLSLDQKKLLDVWLDCLSYAVMILLDHNNIDEAFNLYFEYLKSRISDKEKK